MNIKCVGLQELSKNLKVEKDLLCGFCLVDWSQ